LTAHPTQFYPGTILAIINDLEIAIRNNDIETVGKLLQQLAFTSFYKETKPSPVDEANSLIWYLENVFYSAVLSIHKTVFAILPTNGLVNEDLIELGFWPGGDRDGNPNVTSEVTLTVAELLRKSIIRKYYAEIRLIKRHITFNGVFDDIQQIEKQLQGCLSNDCVLNTDELINNLTAIKNRIDKEFIGLYADEVQNLINSVMIFGGHFASIDIRQDSRVLRDVFSRLSEGKYEDNAFDNDLSRLQWLENFNLPVLKLDNYADITHDTCATIQSIKLIQQKNGEKGCNRFIISNCGRASDIIMLYKLFQANDWGNGIIPMDFIPLFETIDDLENCDATMEQIYKNQP
ncbi:MAG TPA: phosphoenolpyruvate carboxylase, partial [Tenuifilaceae bacterium]|nr:phosphoenolpyruvate carboxylase [Tenuifilaceae bacterium]